MTTTPAVAPRFGILRLARAEALFPAAIGLSAFLLFTLEIISGQLVLPVFGGTAGVWATTLCFFTAVLFLGYLYAHLVTTRLDPVKGGTFHLVVAGIAIVSLILAPRDVSTLRNPGLPEALNVLFALLVIVGPTTFLLASTTPLLSVWYVKHRQNPWWLYAASNGASFLALAASFVIAPVIGLSAQRSLVIVGVIVFVVALAAIILAIRREREAPHGNDPGGEASETAEVTDNAVFDKSLTPTRRRQTVWLFAAFVPAGLLSATTNFITTDLVSAPLLWIGPLAIYLLSFVVAFSARGRRLVRVAQILVPAAAALLWIPWITGSIWPVNATLLVEFSAFFVLAVAIHGRLASDRPDTSDLTRFYLVIAAGGMFATAFVALVAPSVFSAIYEYPILIVAGLLVLALLPNPDARHLSLRPSALLRGAIGRLIPYVVVSAGLIFVTSRGSLDNIGPLLSIFVIAGSTIAIAIRPSYLAATTALTLVLLALNFSSPAVYQIRTFFGVIRVVTAGAENFEYSGTTLHGAQYRDDRRTIPTTYYVTSGPLGQVFEQARVNTERLSVAVVGLGVGTTAAYARNADKFTFFEIDKAVVDIARDPRYFTYLADAPRTPRIVLGDARLSLAVEPAGSYDLIILDAFSSDAVPVHLLTREALTTYARTLRSGGLVLYHLSNRYYELGPAVMATARSLGFSALTMFYDPPASDVESLGATHSEWVVVGSAAAAGPFAVDGWRERASGPVLTDDFSDLLRMIRP